MKKLFCILLSLVALSFCGMNIYADNGRVTYSGNSGEFIFAPGSEYSPTDLFPNFKSVMPGDSIEQDITLKNDADDKVKVNIYIRALGAEQGSEDFLSQLSLRVEKTEENTMGYMFDATASESAQLTDWVQLGTLYSGGEVNIRVLLDVPSSLDNSYQDQIGYLDWEFKVEELPVDDDDPKPPYTGDDEQLAMWITVFTVSTVSIMALIFFIIKKKKQNAEE